MNYTRAMQKRQLNVEGGLQFVHENADDGMAAVRVAFETLQDRFLERWRDIGVEFAWGRDRAFELAAKDFLCCVADEGLLAGQQLVSRNAVCEDIHAMVIGPALQLFGRHIGWR